MKTMKFLSCTFALLSFLGLNKAIAQWNTNGTHIYNTNTGNVGIGASSPATLLYVAKNMTEPNVTVRNLGGTGGATYTMTDDASGANWKFKATLTGGFKIRDHANSLDVIVIEPGSFANALYIKSTDNVGIGTATPASSAAVDINSTTKGFLIPRMTQLQISAILNPVDGLQVYCTTDGKMYIFVAALYQWKEVAYGSGVLPVFCSIGTSLTINHVAGTVAPVTKTVTYGLVTGVPGEPSKCWITRNLGADNQATAVNDATEASAGWYWQFNKKQGYMHDGTVRTPNTTWITSISENSNWTEDKDPCALELGSGWRLPTSTEWTNVDASGGWENWNSPWSSALKMHAAGYLLLNGSLFNRGLLGLYWSSAQSDNSYSWYLYFGSNWSYMYTDSKAYGFSARCLRD